MNNTKLLALFTVAMIPSGIVSTPAPTMPSLEPTPMVEIIPPTEPTASAPVSGNEGGGSSPYFFEQIWGGTLDEQTIVPCGDSMYGCMDITGTSFWKNLMHNLAKELEANGSLPAFPMFQQYL